MPPAAYGVDMSSLFSAYAQSHMSHIWRLWRMLSVLRVSDSTMRDEIRQSVAYAAQTISASQQAVARR